MENLDWERLCETSKNSNGNISYEELLNNIEKQKYYYSFWENYSFIKNGKINNNDKIKAIKEIYENKNNIQNENKNKKYNKITFQEYKSIIYQMTHHTVEYWKQYDRLMQKNLNTNNIDFSKIPESNGNKINYNEYRRNYLNTVITIDNNKDENVGINKKKNNNNKKSYNNNNLSNNQLSSIQPSTIGLSRFSKYPPIITKKNNNNKKSYNNNNLSNNQLSSIQPSTIGLSRFSKHPPIITKKKY